MKLYTNRLVTGEYFCVTFDVGDFVRFMKKLRFFIRNADFN